MSYTAIENNIKLQLFDELKSIFEIYYKKSFSWSCLSSNYYIINTDIVTKYFDKPWNWKKLSQNCNISLDIFETYIDIKDISPIDVLKHTKNPVYFYEKCPKLSLFWDWKIATRNTSIPIDFISKHSNEDWCWTKLSYRSDLTTCFIENNIDKPWVWNELSKHKSITIDFIDKYSDKPWNWRYISLNPNISLKHILHTHPRKKWAWDCISINPYIARSDIIHDNIDLPWDWEKLLQEEELYFPIIQKHSNNHLFFINLLNNTHVTKLDNYAKNCNDYSLLDPSPSIIRNNQSILIPGNILHLDFNKFINREIDTHYIRRHNKLHKKVLIELIETCLHPDNFFSINKLGFFTNIY